MKKTLGIRLAFCVMFLFILFFSNEVLAANEGLTVLNKENNEYIIYLDSTLDKDYEYAFTNSNTANKDDLDYIRAEKETSDGKYVIYVTEKRYNDYFSNGTVYVYVRDLEGNYLADGIEIDLKDCISYDVIDLVNNVTKRIAVDTTQKTVTQRTENGIVYTTTRGRVDITDDSDSEYYYSLVKLPNTEEYNRFMDLAEELNSLKAKSELYENIRMCKEFYDLYYQLMPRAEGWNLVSDMKIEQPLDSKTGDQYILWIRNDSKEIEDVQFLTCFQNEDKEFVKDKNIVKTTSKLPITYDSIVLFVILGVAIVLLIVAVLIKKKTNKEKNINE